MNIGRIINGLVGFNVKTALVFAVLFFNRLDIVTCQSLYEYKITNTVLRKHIEHFDSIYGNDPAAKGKPIGISCSQNGNNIIFLIYYLVGNYDTRPFILCEPINGKQVILRMNDLVKFFQIPERKAVEIFKESFPEEYNDYMRSDTLWINGQWHVPEPPVIFFHFVEWTLRFDRYGNFIGSDIPLDIQLQIMP